MKLKKIHGWRVTVPRAQEIQKDLSCRIITRNELGPVRLVAGVDISGELGDGKSRGAVVIFSYPQMELLEVKTAERKTTFKYKPGFLSFREIPVIASAWEKVVLEPDLVLVDGQGLAHPRRFGLASHLGLLLDIPTIGCAKSRLTGKFSPPEKSAGSFTFLTDNDEIVGAALRTRDGGSPLFISIGYKIDLESSIRWVLQCCRGYRLPEPTRLAHKAASGLIKDFEPTRQQND
ncbi:MAG: deoxyribonuclease V [Dehalococcoidia bacterium]|nr:deoxyribonuclease V [Dehalococcoidia bacterium]